MHNHTIEYSHTSQTSTTDVKPQETTTSTEKLPESKHDSDARVQLMRTIYAESDCV